MNGTEPGLNREHIFQIMMDHLKSAGWERGKDDIVFKELPVMWEKLKDQIPELKRAGDSGMFTFKDFVGIARRMHLFSKMGDTGKFSRMNL